jgi:D-alanine-D-alanine ligase
MRIAIVHYAVKPGASLDELDTLVQAEAVAKTLGELGHEAIDVPCTLDLGELKRQLLALRPDAVFNLMESMEGSCRLIHLVPALFDLLGIPYTGASTETLYLTTNKILAKRMLSAAGLSTSPWIGPYPVETTRPADRGESVCTPDRSFIVKSMWEHASFHLDDDELIPGGDPERLWRILEERAPLLGGSCFAEAYIEGREFNAAMLDGPDGPDFLPPAEILFRDYPKGKLRVVGYRAKWNEESFEYTHTPRHFDFPPEDEGLLARVRDVARRCWDLFHVKGYARVDFRVDARGLPWILEVNANPCIAPDCGYQAALEQAGLTYKDAIARLLAVARARPTTAQAEASAAVRNTEG